MVYRVTNLTPSNVVVEGVTLPGTGAYAYFDSLTTSIENLQLQGRISITWVSTASEVLSPVASAENDSSPIKAGLPPNASGRITDSTPILVNMIGALFPRNIWVVPDSGASVNVEVSEDGGATYATWPLGVATGIRSDIRYDPCSVVRFTLLSGTGFNYGVE